MSARLARLLYIDLKARHRHHLDIRALSEELEVSQRTIEDDFRCLREQMGAPLVYDRERETYRYADPSYRLPAFELSDREMLALQLGQEVLSQVAGDALGPVHRLAVAKIQDRRQDSASYASTDGIWFGGEAGPQLPAKLFRELLSAVQAHHCVRLTYLAASTAAISERTVEPYGLYLHRDTWYLIAYCRLRKDFRYFHLARIQDWDVLTERFLRQADFDMEQYLHRAFRLEQGGEPFEVTIRFMEPTARYVRERRWHPQQRLHELANGAVELTLPAASEREVIQWVLGYGPDAEVLEPASLREVIKKRLTNTLARY